jgi:hypothetical protein
VRSQGNVPVYTKYVQHIPETITPKSIKTLRYTVLRFPTIVFRVRRRNSCLNNIHCKGNSRVPLRVPPYFATVLLQNLVQYSYEYRKTVPSQNSQRLLYNYNLLHVLRSTGTRVLVYFYSCIYFALVEYPTRMSYYCHMPGTATSSTSTTSTSTWYLK